MKQPAISTQRKATVPMARNLYHSLLEDGCSFEADTRKGSLARQQPRLHTQARHARLLPEKWI